MASNPVLSICPTCIHYRIFSHLWKKSVISIVRVRYAHGELAESVISVAASGECPSIRYGLRAEVRLNAHRDAVVGGGIMPFIQNITADTIGDINSYWIVVAMLAYMLFYALVGSRPSKK